MQTHCSKLRSMINCINYDVTHIMCQIGRKVDCLFNILFRLPSKDTIKFALLAPVPLSIFRSNSKFDENSKHSSVQYTRPITTIFCTRHDSVTVVTCAKYRCDRSSIFETRAFWIFIEFRIRSKYAQWDGRQAFCDRNSTTCGHDRCMNTDHYNDVIMGAIASQITILTIVFSIVYSDADQRKHQSSASLAFVGGIHQGPVNSPNKWPVTRKMFPFDDVIM